MAALYAGFKAATFEEGGERYDVRVQVRPEYRDDLDKLELVRVRAPSGRAGSAAQPGHAARRQRPGADRPREPHALDHRLRATSTARRRATADAEVSRASPGSSRFAAGYELRARSDRRSGCARPPPRCVFAFVLALVAIYMILASQFNSFVHPFTIMLSAPLSFIGAFAAIWLLGYSLDVMGQIAFLMLMGIVMKNGILLVDYTNTLRARGLPLYEAVLEAGPTRHAAGADDRGVDDLRHAAASRSAAGTDPSGARRWASCRSAASLTSTLLTLLVVPVVYTLVDEAGGWFAARLRHLRTGRRATTPAA